MSTSSRARALSLLLPLTGALLTQACNNGTGTSGPADPQPGETDFTSTTPPNQSVGRGAFDNAAGPTAGGASTGAAGTTGNPMAPPAAAPNGRVADVQEADIYRIDK